ncbi:hypothetical protein LEP1GSC060_3349 [Leptospira weilii serovar Ranarum str. ICFT]|uniref:Uncharacterized protein n=2 Tax=Leptospira weilii TaxID=28184 RepID=N1WDI8_9LEPT|nr:hypothetical protein LEP1GSC060_3349 [Leptospira weilii serovar Ranarum str. ICFT]
MCYEILYVEVTETSGKKGKFFLDVSPEIEDSNGSLPPIRLSSSGHFGQLQIEKTGKKIELISLYQKIERSVDVNGDKSYCSKQKPIRIKVSSIRRITIVRHIQNVYSPIVFCK